MKRSCMDYAMSVIIGRALPDVRDGLKPANRRVLFAMRQTGLASNRPYRKSAKTSNIRELEGSLRVFVCRHGKRKRLTSPAFDRRTA
jgi:hypothetical protein